MHVRILIGVLLAVAAGWVSYMITSDLLAGEGTITYVRGWTFVYAVAGFAVLLGIAIKNKLELRRYRKRRNE